MPFIIPKPHTLPQWLVNLVNNDSLKLRRELWTKREEAQALVHNPNPVDSSFSSDSKSGESDNSAYNSKKQPSKPPSDENPKYEQILSPPRSPVPSIKVLSDKTTTSSFSSENQSFQSQIDSKISSNPALYFNPKVRKLVTCRICEQSFDKAVLKEHSEFCFTRETCLLSVELANNELRSIVAKMNLGITKEEELDLLEARETETQEEMFFVGSFFGMPTKSNTAPQVKLSSPEFLHALKLLYHFSMDLILIRFHDPLALEKMIQTEKKIQKIFEANQQFPGERTLLDYAQSLPQLIVLKRDAIRDFSKLLLRFPKRIRESIPNSEYFSMKQSRSSTPEPDLMRSSSSGVLTQSSLLYSSNSPPPTESDSNFPYHNPNFHVGTQVQQNEELSVPPVSRKRSNSIHGSFESPKTKSKKPMTANQAEVKSSLKHFFKDSNPPKDVSSDRNRHHHIPSLIHEYHMPNISDFTLIKPLTRGAFGKVYLIKKNNTGDLFALKVLRKRDFLVQTSINRIQTERQILSVINHPHIISLYFSFQSTTHLFLVMDYLPGGDLHGLLNKIGSLPIDAARMFIAQCISALEHLHSKGIIHRDLKPDNMLVDKRGHLQLIDFGLSTVFNLKTSTTPLELRMKHARSNTDSTLSPIDSHSVFGKCTQLQDSEFSDSTNVSYDLTDGLGFGGLNKRGSVVGTIDYIPPECLSGHGSASVSDFWSVGCVLFEMVSGIPPFPGKNRDEVFDRILKSQIEWKVFDRLQTKLEEEILEPASCAENPALEYQRYSEAAAELLFLRDLLEKLLVVNPQQRLGSNGFYELKKHKFFEGIQWNNLEIYKSIFKPSFNPKSLTFSFPDPENTHKVSFDGRQRAQAVQKLLRDIAQSGLKPMIHSRRDLGVSREFPHFNSPVKMGPLSANQKRLFGGFTFINLENLHQKNQEIAES